MIMGQAKQRGSFQERIAAAIARSAGIPADLDSSELNPILRRFNPTGENDPDMIQDPSGPFPACNNKIGTYECEECGREVRGKRDACPMVPTGMRWRFKATGSASPTNSAKS